MKKVSIVGASGYTGGEALRMLLAHPEFEVVQVTSERLVGKPVSSTHPNLRSFTDLKFTSSKDLEKVDVLFLGLPHGKSQERLDEFLSTADVLCDLASDFRLSDPTLYEKFYGKTHTCLERSDDFAYAVPEINREEIANRTHLAGAGCIATCSLTSLFPLFKNGIISNNTAFIDAKIGSSAAGAKPSVASHHAERAGALRSYKPTVHRHAAELLQYLPKSSGEAPTIHLSATSTPLVRGILVTAQLIVDPKVTERDIWSCYRESYSNEPFVRIVKDKRSIYGYPEPKILAGTNFVDIGFELEPDTGRLVVMGAIDNLVKGSAGNVIQSLNIKFGFEERLGLEFSGLHPV